MGNKAQCAAFFDVTLSTIEAWIRKGMPIRQQGSRGVAWEIDMLEVCKWRFAGQDSGGEVDPDSLEPMQRRAWYEGETKKRELQVRDGELIPRAEVERVLATAFAAVAASRRSIPDNLERKYGLPSEFVERVEAAIDEDSDALADRLSRLAPIDYGVTY